MPKISEELLKAKLTILKIRDFSTTVINITNSLEVIKQLVKEDILTSQDYDQTEIQVKAILRDYLKSKILLAVEESAILSLGSSLEVSQQIKNLAPIISGVPVITPPPTVYEQDAISTIALGVITAKEVITLVDRINNLLK